MVLAEEWHAANAVLHLDWLLRRAGLRERVTLLWNANNSFGFERIDWPRLARAATITTVSRYMRQRMWPLGVDPIVIPNGLVGLETMAAGGVACTGGTGEDYAVAGRNALVLPRAGRRGGAAPQRPGDGVIALRRGPVAPR